MCVEFERCLLELKLWSPADHRIFWDGVYKSSTVAASDQGVRPASSAVRSDNASEPGILGARKSVSTLLKAANYRAACRGRSRADFISKIGVVLEEADESVFWLELMKEAGKMPEKKVEPLLSEAKQLTAIFAATKITAQSNSGTKSHI